MKSLNVPILSPAREIDKQVKQKRVTINGHYYLTCEICKEQKKERNITTRCGHVICFACARSPKRQREAMLSERLDNLRNQLAVTKELKKFKEEKTKDTPEFKTAFEMLGRKE